MVWIKKQTSIDIVWKTCLAEMYAMNVDNPKPSRPGRRLSKDVLAMDSRDDRAGSSKHRVSHGLDGPVKSCWHWNTESGFVFYASAGQEETTGAAP